MSRGTCRAENFRSRYCQDRTSVDVLPETDLLPRAVGVMQQMPCVLVERWRGDPYAAVTVACQGSGAAARSLCDRGWQGVSGPLAARQLHQHAGPVPLEGQPSAQTGPLRCARTLVNVRPASAGAVTGSQRPR